MTDTTNNLWSDVSNSSGWGVAFGCAQPPTYLIATSNYNPYLITYGNDVFASGGGTPRTLSANTTFLDNVVMVVWPHAGDWSSVSDDVQGMLEGVGTSLGSPEGQ